MLAVAGSARRFLRDFVSTTLAPGGPLMIEVIAVFFDRDVFACFRERKKIT